MTIARLGIGFSLLGLLSSVGVPRVNAQTVYWTDIGSNEIQRANLDGGAGVEDLVTGVFTSVDIALYLDGTDGEFLITGLTSPSGIALELQVGTPTGACCFGNGFCTPQTQEDCESVLGQVYLGDGTECVGDFTCPTVCWNCLCLDGFQESDQSAVGCVAEEAACNDVCQGHGGLQSFDCDLGPCVAGCPFNCGDIDGSGGNVNLVDFASFAVCLGGLPSSSTACACSDLNGDGTINLLDFATFSVMHGSQSTTTIPNCY